MNETSDEEVGSEDAPAPGGGATAEEAGITSTLESLSLPEVAGSDSAQSRPTYTEEHPAPPPPPQPPPAADISTYALPAHPPARNSLPREAYLELDALTFAILGTRLEWDFFCPEGESSPCTFNGPLPAMMPISGVDGLYHCHPSVLPLVVSAMASNHARGLVIVSPDTDFGSPPFVCPAFGPKSKSATRRVPWRQLLDDFTVLRIMVPPMRGHAGALAIYASFLHAVPLRPSKKKITRITARPVRELAGSDGLAKLGPVPELLTRPTRAKARPPKDLDTVKEAPCPSPDLAASPALPPS